MKTNIVWLLIAMLVGVNGYSQIYPDDSDDLLMDYSRHSSSTLVSGSTDKKAKFPSVTEEHDWGDGPMKCVVETVLVNTDRVLFTNPKSGKEAVNALSVWLIQNSFLDIYGERKLILKVEFKTTTEKNSSAQMQGMKVSFTRIRKDSHPGFMPKLVFLPTMESGKPVQKIVSASEAESIEKELIGQYIGGLKNTVVLWKSPRQATLPDGRVVIDGVMLATKVSATFGAKEIKTYTVPVDFGGANVDLSGIEDIEALRNQK